MAIPATPQPPNALTAIKNAAKANGVSWQAMASIAQRESGLDPSSVGDNGTSFGLYQLHQGGALPKGTSPQLAKDPVWNANFAARQIKGLGIGGAMPVEQQISQIARRFERPADPQGEINAALGYYKTRYAGLPQQPQQTAAPASLGSAPAETTAQPNLQTLLPLQQSLNLGNQQNQRALDALGKLSGRNVQAAAAPDLSQLIAQQQAQPQQAAAPTAHVSVPLKGPTPKGLTSEGQKAVELAKHYLGTKYVFGGASPKAGFDCSGLIQWTMAQLGIKIPRTAAEQAKAGKPVNTAHLEPGDALSFSEDGVIGHTGMYIGGGQFIQAPHTGDVVKISPLAGHYQSILVGARRFT